MAGIITNQMSGNDIRVLTVKDVIDELSRFRPDDKVRLKDGFIDDIRRANCPTIGSHVLITTHKLGEL